jgi:hypothetical protein
MLARRGRPLRWRRLVLAQVCLTSIGFTAPAYASSDSSSQHAISLTGPTLGDMSGAPGFAGGGKEITTTCTDPAATATKRRHNAPEVTIDNLKIVPEPRNPKPTSFHIVLSGRDFAMVTEGMRSSCTPDRDRCRAPLRCHFLASVQPRPRYRITKVSETVTSGGALNAMRSSAVITTQTSLGGVALPASGSKTTVEAQYTQYIPSVSIPALSQCAASRSRSTS